MEINTYFKQELLKINPDKSTLVPQKSINLFINDTIPTTSQCLDLIYRLHKDKDGFLYISYTFENTFG